MEEDVTTKSSVVLDLQNPARDNANNIAGDMNKEGTPGANLSLQDNKNQIAGETDNEVIPRAYVCHFCGERKNTKKVIMLHYRKKHGVCRNLTTNTVYKKRAKCIACKTTKGCAHSMYIMYYQNQRRSKKMLTTCRSCPDMFWGKQHLLDHIDRHHLKDHTYTCEQCQKKFRRNITYRYHMQKNHSEIQKCSYCDSGNYTNIARLLKHQAVCKNIRRKFACDKCPSTFDTDKKLLYHKNKHNNIYCCTLCTKTFVAEYKLKDHQRFHILIESDKNPTYTNKCSICQLQLYNRDELKVHVSENHNQEDKHYCSTCDQKLDSRSQFLRHLSKYSHRVKINPNIRKSFECVQCDFTSKSATALESHVNSLHLKIKPFKCESCPKSFTDNQKLKFHAKTHSKVRTHKCAYCDQLFCGPLALRKHKAYHTYESPHSCFICGFPFISSSRVLAHQKQCHYVRTVECPKCFTLFPYIAAMRMHFKFVHWDHKDEEFDIEKVQGLTERQKDWFRDHRFEGFGSLPNMDDTLYGAPRVGWLTFKRTPKTRITLPPRENIFRLAMEFGKRMGLRLNNRLATLQLDL